MRRLIVICFVFVLEIPRTLTAVDCGMPSISLNTDYACVELDSISLGGTTEGHTYTIPCKTLLKRTMANIDYCPIGLCKADGHWTSTAISCGSSECVNGTSSNYKGKRICTQSGRACQSWDSQSPHPHPFTNLTVFPDGSISAAGSYCRDPDNTHGQPWCYTMDPGVIWETCDIPNCTGVSFSQGVCPNDYCGDPDMTIASDHECASCIVGPHDRNKDSLMTGQCVSLLWGHTSTNFPYCPVKRCLADSYWTEQFSIGCGVNECYTAGQSDQYNGGRACTVSGWLCQDWDLQTPHSHVYSLPGVGALCRDPGGFGGQPWCYIDSTDPGLPDWEYCDVPECSTKTVDSGTCTTTTSTSSSTTVPLTTTAATTTATTTSTPAITTSTIMITTTTGTTTTTTAAPVFPGIPVPGEKYNRIRSDVDAFGRLYFIPDIVSTIRCSKHCSQQPTCVFFTVSTDNTCELFEQDSGVLDKLLCSTTGLRCYKHESVVIP